MKSRKFTALVIMTFSLSLFLYFNLGANIPMNTESFKGIEPIVIFDAAHYQKFNHTQMQSAIQFIEDEYEIDVVINEDNFTLTNLRGADLLILPAPYFESPNTGDAAGPYSEIEQRAVLEFYQDGGSVLYLANPYFFETNLRNFSSNLNDINYLMAGGTEDESNYDGLAFDRPIHTLMNDFTHKYNDERLIYINNDTLAVNHSIIAGFPDADPVNELLIHSTSLIRTSNSEKIINTTSSTYEVNDEGEVPFGGTKTYTIMAAEEKATSRGISCASAIMFSDLVVLEGETTTTWWESYDNALLWKNMIYWLLLEIPVPEPVNYVPEFGMFTIIFIAIFFVFMVFGSILFTIGRESKRAEVSEVLIKMRERDDRRQKVDEEIEEAFYAEDTAADDEAVVEEEVKEKDVDMQSISDEVRKKPPKTRSRSERRRRG